MFVRLVGVAMPHMNSYKRMPLNERTSPKAAYSVTSSARAEMTAERKSSGRKRTSSSRFEVGLPFVAASGNRPRLACNVVLDAAMRVILGDLALL
jgi:hypothetical protein